MICKVMLTRRSSGRGKTAPLSLNVGQSRADMKDEAREYRSIVILLPRQHRLTDSEMATIAERSLGIAPDGDKDSQDWCLPVIEGGQYMLKSNGIIMILHNRAVPFFDDPEIVADCIQGDPELATYIRSHQATITASVPHLVAETQLPSPGTSFMLDT